MRCAIDHCQAVAQAVGTAAEQPEPRDIGTMLAGDLPLDIGQQAAGARRQRLAVGQLGGHRQRLAGAACQQPSGDQQQRPDQPVRHRRSQTQGVGHGSRRPGLGGVALARIVGAAAQAGHGNTPRRPGGRAHRARRCNEPPYMQGVAPLCLDWAALTATAGDQACSGRQMLDTALTPPWILQVADVGALPKADLARIPVVPPASVQPVEVTPETIGMRADAASPTRFLPSQVLDQAGGILAAVPARSGPSLRLRAPFFLGPDRAGACGGRARRPGAAAHHLRGGAAQGVRLALRPLTAGGSRRGAR